METIKELMKIIYDNINTEYWTFKTPIRCTLNWYYGKYNILGYGVEFFDREGGSELLFIADTPEEDLFHYGGFIFVSKYFKDRCLWIDADDITYINTEGFYI